MKTFVTVAATTLIAASMFDSTMGISKYLDEIPNGRSFTQELGHPDTDSSKYTEFATAFADAGHVWSADFCAKTFPGSSMTNGEAFGDPCCTWSKGDTPDATVTAFTTSPTKATVCASSTGGSTNSATSESPTTEFPTTNPPVTEAPAPATEVPSTTESPAYTNAPSTTESLVVTDPPVTESPASGGCGVKSNNPHQSYRRFRH